MRIAISTACVLSAAFALAACSRGEQQATANPCNPCAAANPCAATATNPCAGGAMPMIDASRITQGTNPLYTGMPETQLVARGKELWNDKALSKSGSIACSTCHVNNYQQMQASFAQPYPHRVAMVKQRAGLDQVNASEMVQMCLVVPMNSDPLPWNSVELAALTAYVKNIQRKFDPSKAAGGRNPCNPCAGS